MLGDCGSEYINMDKYLLDIARDKRYWERKREEIRRERKRLEEAATKYETDLEVINKQKKEILTEAGNRRNICLPRAMPA